MHAAGVAVADFVEALGGLGACDFGFAFGGEGGAGWVEAGHFEFGEGADEEGVGHFVFDLGKLGFAVEGGESLEELVVGDAVGRWGRNFEEDVEVIGHEAVGEDSAAGEGFAFAHDFAEVFAFVLVKDEAAVDDAGDAVVEGGFGGGVFPGG